MCCRSSLRSRRKGVIGKGIARRRPDPNFLLAFNCLCDIVESFAAVDDESNCAGKSSWKRIVSMLPRLIQRTVTVAEKRTEYEYRSAEYE